MRSHYCGQVNEKLVGQEVTVAGWVHRRRDHGGVIFVDLRDREGLLQVVFDPDNQAQFNEAEKLRNEFVVQVRGLVRERPAGTANANLASGKVELLARELVTLNRAEPLPFQLDEHVSEEVRLKYRYIDLRREEMAKRLRLRHKITRAMRHYLDDAGFVDIETPVLTKATPEGARDYLVPSRTHAGKFFALPQSPQIFKQLLMVAGFDRYYQIVKCFRDEDLRADRQPEFTQLDIETSFLSQEQIMEIDGGAHASLLQGRHRRRSRRSVSAHGLRGSHAPFRFRQARPAQPARARRRGGSRRRLRLQGVRRSRERSQGPRGRAARAGRRRDAAFADRRVHRVCRALRREGSRVHQGERDGEGQGRPAVAHREVPVRRFGEGHPRAHRRERWRPHFLRRGQREGS